MSISTAIIWEVRTGGSDTNGGGFKAGASGVDYTLQNAAQYALTNGGATTGSAVITTVSAAADMVGNVAYIAGGSGSITAGWYEIISVVVGVSITVDRATGLVTGSGVTINVGGALLTIGTATAQWVINNTIYVKSGTYTVTTAISVASLNALPNTSPNKILGYTTTRGDNGQPTITTATNALTLMTCLCENIIIANFIFDCALTTTSIGFAQTSGNAARGFHLVNCIAKNFTSKGFAYTGGTFIKCYATGGTTAASAAFSCSQGSGFHYGCVARSNSCHGFIVISGNVYVRCIAASNKTGGTYNGFTANGTDNLTSSLMLNCVAYDNSGNGLLINGTYEGLAVLNSIFVINGAYGINFSVSKGTIALPTFNYNAFYNNTTNPRNNIPAGANDITLTGDPFNGGATGDFSLNNTANQGAALRALAALGLFPDGLSTGYEDIGAVQHQDTGGGGQKSFTF